MEKRGTAVNGLGKRGTALSIWSREGQLLGLEKRQTTMEKRGTGPWTGKERYASVNWRQDEQLCETYKATRRKVTAIMAKTRAESCMHRERQHDLN